MPRKKREQSSSYSSSEESEVKPKRVKKKPKKETLGFWEKTKRIMGNAFSCLNSKKAEEEDSKTTDEAKSSSSSSSAENSSDKKGEKSNSVSDVSNTQEKTPCIKILLLGAGGVGKSTVFKIITNQTIDMFTDESDLREFRDSIQENVTEAMKTVIKNCQTLKKYEDENGNEFDCRINKDRSDDVELLLNWENEELNPKAVDAIENLKEDEGFMTCLTKLRHLYNIPDGAPYFLNKIDEIWSSEYVPTFQDILYCRDRTTGVTHEELPFNSNGKKYTLDLYDVGGQRAERRAWKKIFDNVGVIIFVFASNEFNRTCIEDSFTNRMVESLSVLKVLNSAKVFAKTPILLLLTKVDQLEEKLKDNVPFVLPSKEAFQNINVADYPSYSGDNTIEDVKKYLVKVCKCQLSEGKKVVAAFKNLMGEDVSFNDQLEEVLQHVNTEKTDG